MRISAAHGLFAAGFLLAGCGGGSVSTLPATPPGAQSGAHAARVPAGDTSVVITWDHALLAAVRDLKPAPTVVSRALAVTHTAEYDAWAPYDATAAPSHQTAVGRRPYGERSLANKEIAISYAAYRTLSDLFPTERATFDATMRGLGFDPGDARTDRTAPAGIGNAAAAAVLEERHRDGANQLGDLHPGAYSDYTGYVPVNTVTTVTDPNRWQPLAVTLQNGASIVQTFTTPQWRNVKPFALPSGAALRPGPPPAYNSAERNAEIDELIQISRSLDDRTKAIAEYWMDGPNSELPPGHWCMFAEAIGQRDHHGIDDDVKLLFALSNAELDAGIAVWDAKVAYDSVRPVSAIRYRYRGTPIVAWAGAGKGAQPIDGGTWEPYQPSWVVTPPFAEYLSGHSAFSTAAAEILKSYTGSDAFGYSHTVLAGSSRVEPGVVPATTLTFTYATFSEAADEAGMSRRYGGIHFRSGDIASRAVGRAVGRLVWQKARALFAGSPAS